MEEIRETKDEIRSNIVKTLSALSDSEIEEKIIRIENRLFEFANFLEANIVLYKQHQRSEYAKDNKKMFKLQKNCHSSCL